MDKNWKFRNYDNIEILQFSNNYFYIKKNNKFLFKFIKLLIFINYNVSSKFFNLKTSNYLNFYAYQKKSIIIFDSNKILNKWENSYNLLLNIFFYSYYPIVLSNYWHKNTSMSLNWFFNKWELSFWKYMFPFFFYKKTIYSEKSDYFFYQLKKKTNKFIIITDCSYHYPKLFYLKKHDFYSLGLTSIDVNPWSVSYPIFMFVNSFLIQSFFFKLIIYSYKLSFLNKFIFFKKIWINNFYFKYL